MKKLFSLSMVTMMAMSTQAVAALLVALLTMTAQTAQAQGSDVEWTQGSGTAADPYIISTKEQLDLLAHRVNGSHGQTCQADGFKDKYFKLGANITYAPNVLTIDNDGDGTMDSNYEAIGCYNLDPNSSNNFYFFGNFDGDGHTISGIRIYKKYYLNPSYAEWGYFLDTSSGGIGLFGMVGEGANIHHVVLADANFTGSSDVL